MPHACRDDTIDPMQRDMGMQKPSVGVDICGMWVHTGTDGSHGNIWGVQLSPCRLFLRQVLSLNLELDWQLPIPISSCLFPSQGWGYRYKWPCPGFNMSAGDLNSGPHACITSDPTH